MSWIDILLVLLLTAMIALGVQRRLAGLLLGVGGVLLLRPLLVLGQFSPLLSVAIALGAGALLALLARWIYRRRPLPDLPFAVLGGLGGGLLGVTLVLSTAVALPIGRNATGHIVYPPQDLPGVIAPAVQGSRIFREGRDILLYPLLEGQGDISAARRPVVRALHSYLVVGEPWEGR